MPPATYADFKAKTASKKTVVGTATVPGLGEVSICKMSAADRDRVQRTLLREEESALYRARVVVAVVCNDQGDKLFTDKDEAWISQLDADLLEPIINAVNQKAQAVTEKNSETTPSDASP